MPKPNSSRHGPSVPPESTFASLELVAINNVFFAVGEDAASVGYDEPEGGDSDVMRAQEWLVAVTEKARKQAARREDDKSKGDFTRRYVDIDTVDLGDDDGEEDKDQDEEDYAQEDDDDDDSAYGRDEERDDESEERSGEEDSDGDRKKHGKRRKSSGKVEWRPYDDDDGHMLKDDEGRHDQYDMIELISARQDDFKDAAESVMHQDGMEPDKKRKRVAEDVPSITVATSFVDTDRPRSSLVDRPVRGSELLEKTMYTEEDAERLSKLQLPVREKPKPEPTATDKVEPMVISMPRIGESDGGVAEAEREKRHRRHEKILRCDVADFVREKLTPYYKAKRFANKESYKELAKHLTDKVVTAKIAANSLVMTDNTRSRISKLVYKTMHPHGAHHFVYDASQHHRATDEDDATEDFEDYAGTPSPLQR